MIKVVYIRETKEKEILSLGISEGEEISRYVLDSTFVTRMGLSLGEIDGDEYSQIRERDLYIRGKRKALSLLAFADNSKRRLLVKLLRFGLDRSTAERIVDEMASLGYINEDDQISRLVERLANGQLIGPKKIIARLVAKGYRPDAVRHAMRALTESGEVDFSENKRILLEKHSVVEGDTEEENKLLYKNGY